MDTMLMQIQFASHVLTNLAKNVILLTRHYVMNVQQDFYIIEAAFRNALKDSSQMLKRNASNAQQTVNSAKKRQYVSNAKTNLSSMKMKVVQITVVWDLLKCLENAFLAKELQIVRNATRRIHRNVFNARQQNSYTKAHVRINVPAEHLFLEETVWIVKITALNARMEQLA
jgi:hypothetical protein